MSVLVETQLPPAPKLGEEKEDLGDSPPPAKKVKWEVEDPSEFRPGLLDNIGREQETFRVFYDVSSRLIFMQCRSLS